MAEGNGNGNGKVVRPTWNLLLWVISSAGLVSSLIGRFDKTDFELQAQLNVLRLQYDQLDADRQERERFDEQQRVQFSQEMRELNATLVRLQIQLAEEMARK